MNWFDTSGIASLAKNALKEAQKQIDKALDIKDENGANEPGMDDASAANVGEMAISGRHYRTELAENEPNVEVHPIVTDSKDTPIDEDARSDKEPIQSRQVSSLWGSFTGSFFEHSTDAAKNVTVTKPPLSYKRGSYEDVISGEMSKASSIDHSKAQYLMEQTLQVSSPGISPQTEIDSSDSIEILSSLTTPVSTLTSPCQLPPDETTQYDYEPESAELLGTLGTSSSLPSPQSLTVADHSTFQRQDAGNESSYLVLSSFQMRHRSSDDHDDDISIEDDSISYTLSEPPITVVDSNDTLPPITVAPTRSSLHLTLSSSFSPKNVQEGGHRISTVQSNSNVPIQSSTLRIGLLGMEESIDPAEMVESRNNRHRPLQEAQNEEQDLDRSYENVEIQTQTSDSTHSFEEITPSGSVLCVEMDGTSHKDNDGNQGSAQVTVTGNSSGRTTESSQTLGDGAVHVSPPNSGDDEIETTTSSDIEIISSPNGGDSSSTHSNGAYRTSPLKTREGKSDEIDILLIEKHCGHKREPSEVSVHSRNSDELCNMPESERLLRRLAEVSETLEQREYRLVELGRQNAELHEQNTVLLSQLETNTKWAAEGGADSEGYTQRLSALERKFQQSIREKEVLKRQLHAMRAEEKQKVARREMEKALNERDFIIGELQKEGESLSKQVLQHSNIIKKLRLKEKESDALIRKQVEEIGELMDEAERLKRSLSAKEEVERSQIDAVHKLSAEKQKLELDCALFKSNLDDQAQRVETLQRSFDFAKRELSEQAESYRELQQRSTKLQVIEAEHGRMQQASEQMTAQLEELREQLRLTENDYGQRLLRTKQEQAELLSRLEATEMRAEEEKNVAASLTVPLMKQLEALQNTLRHKERIWEQREATITQQVTDAVQQSRSIADRERMQREQITSMQSRIANLEERLTAALFKLEETTNEHLLKQVDVELLERDMRKQITLKNEECLILSERLCEKESLVSKLEQRLQYAFIGTGSTVACSGQHHSHQSSLTNEATAFVADASADNTTALNISKRGVRESSPTPSIGNLSLSESLASMPWNGPDEEIDSLANNSAFPEDVSCGTTVHLLNNTSLLEMLQATLKQRDGEVQQLQWELNRFKQERHALNTEISILTTELDNIREKSERIIDLEKEHMEQQKRYDALLQMYGESVEKTDELRLDLIDVKDMYKLQIDDLLRQQRELITTINSRQNDTTTRYATDNPE